MTIDNIVKNIIWFGTRYILPTLLSVPTIIKIFVNGFSNFSVEDGVMIGITVLYLITQAYYQYTETKEKKNLKDLEQKENAIRSNLLYIKNQMHEYSKNIYNIISNARKNSSVDLSNWNHMSICTTEMADNIVKILKEYCNPDCSLGVDIFLGVRVDNEMNYKLVAHDSKHAPDLNGQIFNSKMGRKYHFNKILHSNRSSIECILNEQELDREFHKGEGNYSQCFDVPIRCEERYTIGLIEILTDRGHYLFPQNENKQNIREVLELLIRPYAYLILTAEKVEKGLTMLPKQEEIK